MPLRFLSRSYPLIARMQGRDNNFNLLRLAAASAVLITHSFAIAIGSGDAEPLRGRLGMTLGHIAVDVFFITSGFLVAGSLARRQRAADFIMARVLRIFPALAVMLLLVVYGIGACLTSLPIGDYLDNPGTHRYFLKGFTLITGVGWILPGVFELNPFRQIVNGSLWTLPYECAMYVALLAVWVACLRLVPAKAKAFSLVALVTAALLGIALLVTRVGFDIHSDWLRLAYMFSCGVAFFVWRDQVVLSTPVVVGLVTVGAMALILRSQGAFFATYAMSLGYVVLYLAYVPTGRILLFNRAGDYSYGVYIYAFPIQQSIASLYVGISATGMMLLSGVVTLAMAIASWHLIEKPALSLKRLAHGS